MQSCCNSTIAEGAPSADQEATSSSVVPKSETLAPEPSLPATEPASLASGPQEPPAASGETGDEGQTNMEVTQDSEGTDAASIVSVEHQPSLLLLLASQPSSSVPPFVPACPAWVFPLSCPSHFVAIGPHHPRQLPLAFASLISLAAPAFSVIFPLVNKWIADVECFLKCCSPENPLCVFR